MKRVAFYTLGCKVNQYETEAISELFVHEGFVVVPFEETADVYVINTCTVTNLSDKKSRHIIRRAKKTNKDAIVVVTGCYAQVSKEEVMAISGVDIVTGTSDRAKIVNLVMEKAANRTIVHEVSVNDIMKDKHFENLQISAFTERTRAYIKIQDGCNQFCTYCIIPFARGPIRSKTISDILHEVTRLASEGYKEIVLTGIHMTSYGKDLGLTLLNVFEAIYDVEGLERIRLGSLEPGIIDETFVKYVAAHPKICIQFHLSLQSGCDATLERMNRKYDTTSYKNSVQLIRKYLEDVAITTDVMVGFPGETQEEFLDTLKFVEEIGFARMHIFKFSPRKGTKAFDMVGQIDASIKEFRSSVLFNLSNKMQYEFNKKFEGRVMNVLYEYGESDNWELINGYTSNYIKVISKGEKALRGSIISTLLEKAENDAVIGIIHT